MGRERVTRRRVLATAAGAVLAGCAAPAAQDTPTATPTPGARTAFPDVESPSPYTRVYRGTIGSVVAILTFDSTGRRAQGSGFVFREDVLVTNEHVVAGADGVKVRFSGGEWRTATVVGTDVYSDLAALRVDGPPDYADPLPLAEGDPAVGQEVVALGNPFGFRESVSAGIVSGVDRSLPGANNFAIPDAIQTDAAVNPGNSGGPLVALDGTVVGVITSAGGENLGFAISAEMVRRVVPALVEDGEYDHPYMGVRLLAVTPTVAEANDLERPRGVLVVDVVPEGPSDGVLRGSDDERFVDGTEVPVGGDVIVALDGRPITTLEALSTYLALNTAPGDEMDVGVVRDGERRTVTMTLGERPPPTESPSMVDAGGEAGER